MTVYGLNPSFCNWSSRLPLFADPLRRARAFEVFREDGTPTGEPSEVGWDGWPVGDGRWHGVRLFGDQEGFMPELPALTSVSPDVAKLRVSTESAFLSWKTSAPELGGKIAGLGYLPQWIRDLVKIKPAFHDWHLPSGEALQYFKPKVLRTLDWGWQARKEKRPNWTKRRVLPEDPLQGEEMALELQCDAANLLGCRLWWNIPPRFELTVAEYQDLLRELLDVLKDNCQKPPVLEYGNELWNASFPVHQWLVGEAEAGSAWHGVAGDEIATVRILADEVFGEPGAFGEKPYILFVGGSIADGGFSLDRILTRLQQHRMTADAAGPAFYVMPLRSDKDRWTVTGEIPTQDQLKESMLANIPSLRTKMDAHRSILKDHLVPYFCVYEAGQSLIANGRPWKAAALEAQKSEWMGNIYREIRSQLKEAKVDVACWYSCATSQTPDDPRVDCFGMLEATLDKAEPLPKAVAARGEE